MALLSWAIAPAPYENTLSRGRWLVAAALVRAASSYKVQFSKEGCVRRKQQPNHREFAMPLLPDKAAFQNSLANLPLVTYQPGETVIADGSRTGRLLILRNYLCVCANGTRENMGPANCQKNGSLFPADGTRQSWL
jgi:hypothetical protein